MIVARCSPAVRDVGYQPRAIPQTWRAAVFGGDGCTRHDRAPAHQWVHAAPGPIPSERCVMTKLTSAERLAERRRLEAVARWNERQALQARRKGDERDERHFAANAMSCRWR